MQAAYRPAMTMLARTIQLDVSDANVFPLAARPGEWAVTGTFAFADGDPATWENKQQIAFRDGWLGTESFGRASFVQVTTVSETEYEATVQRLAAHIFETYHPPGMLDAMQAARAEVEDMAALSAHPVGTLLAMEREMTEQGIVERTRVIEPPDDAFHARIWSVDDAPAEPEK